jgi:hypothetical protein
MSYRRTAMALVASSVLAAGLPAVAATELPRVACSKRLVDPEGDAPVNYTGVSGVSTGSAPGLDILGVYLRLTADEFHVLLPIKDIPPASAMPLTDTAYRYTVTFKYEAKTFTFGAMLRNPSHPAEVPFDANSYPQANMGTGANDQLPGFTASIDPQTDYVVWTAPRAQIEKNLDTRLADGDQFTAIFAKTIQNLAVKLDNADETAFPADKAVYVVGDDYCFGPPPTTLGELGSGEVQYGDPLTLSAKLLDEAGEPLAGQPVTFAVAGESGAPPAGTTGEDGVARATYRPTLKAGTYALTATFAGNATAARSKVTGTVVVKTEGTAFKPLQVARPSTTARTVTATLLDDDGKAVTGQKVDFYVNGKKAGSPMPTDAAGRTVFKAAKPGQTVQARLPAVTGKYAAASSGSVKA